MVPERLFRPSERLIEMTGEKIRKRVRRLSNEIERIPRTQPHRPLDASDRLVRLAEIDTDEPAQHPADSEIRIDRERLIDERHPIVELADNKGQRMPASRKRDRIILAQRNRAPSQPLGFGVFARTVEDPAIGLAPDIAPRRHAVRCGEIRIALDGLEEMTQRIAVGPSIRRRKTEACYPAHIVLVS